MVYNAEKTEETKEDKEKKAKAAKRNAVTGHTRCYVCYSALPLTDWSDPDETISKHVETKHSRR